MEALLETNYFFPGQEALIRGKVRDVYLLKSERLVLVATDRISAFDVLLPEAIPYKGEILNQIAAEQLEATSDIVPNWLEAVPDPAASVGLKCQPFPVEMVVRGYLCGHAWREYKTGKRTLCGAGMPDGMKEFDRFPEPLLTPATKAESGHDEDITPEEILERGLCTKEEWEQLREISLQLFQRGTERAAQHGLVLADTKYEFGKRDGRIYLIDEVHTPDSSRYFYAEGYEERQQAGERQKQLSKEFVREWLMSMGFQGRVGEELPPMTGAVVESIQQRYLELYQTLMGKPFSFSNRTNLLARIEENVRRVL